MTWTELIEQCTPHLPLTEPPLAVDRVPQDYRRKKYNKIANRVGRLGQIGLATLNLSLSELPLQAGEPFFTRVRCDVTLPKFRTLTMTPKSGHSGKPPRWKIQTDLPESITDSFTDLLTEAARDGAPALRLLLTPLEDQTPGGGQHRLCVSTGVFQDQVDNLCADLDWHPTDPEGRPLSSLQAAELLLQRMASVCLQARALLLDQIVSQ